MKSKIEKIKEFLIDNKWLLSLLIFLALFVFCQLWTWSFDICKKNSKAVNNLVGKEYQDETSIDTDIISGNVQYTEDGVFLLDNIGNVLSGPYRKIYDDEYSDYGISRFIGENGLIGYLSKENGEIIVESKFIRATKMKDGAALVCESEEEGIYYISRTGERLTDRFYVNGYEFSESQGTAARVEVEDGSWGIINKQGEFLVKDMQCINELPYVTVIGSGINNNGHAVLFKLPVSESEKYEEICEYPQFNDISEVWYGEFAIVKNAEGLYGVVSTNGEIIVQDQNISVEWEKIFDDEDPYLDMMVFTAQRQDGKYDIVTWRP